MKLDRIAFLENPNHEMSDSHPIGIEQSLREEILDLRSQLAVALGCPVHKHRTDCDRCPVREIVTSDERQDSIPERSVTPHMPSRTLTMSSSYGIVDDKKLLSKRDFYNDYNTQDTALGAAKVGLGSFHAPALCQFHVFCCFPEVSCPKHWNKS